jgi:Tfp pilus assembly protein PilF
MKRTRHIKYYLAGSVALITCVVYLTALRNDFVNWDDSTYVTENPHIRSINAAFLRWAFFDFYASNWHPLTWISHALDYALWGLNPLGHHLTSIILHTGNTALSVFLMIRLMEAMNETAVENKEGSFLTEHEISITAGIAGLMFGLHPVHVESVAWVAERKDLLCALFFMLSIATYTGYVRHADSGKVREEFPSVLFRKRYLCSLGFFALALMSKPMAVSLPAVLMILDWYPFRRILSLRTFRVSVFGKFPFFLLSLASSVITILAQRAGGALASMDVIPLSTRLLAAARAVVIYLWKIVMPVNLFPFYQYPRHISLLTLAGYFVAFAAVIGVTVVCLILVRKEKVWLSVWGYYLITLFPVLGIVQVGSQFMADRYIYLPSLGPFLVLGLMVVWAARKMKGLVRWRQTVMYGSTALAVTATVFMTYLTVKQIDIWKNSLTLWNSAIEKEPEGVPMAYYGLGTAYQKMGLNDKAIENFDKAIALDQALYQAYDNKGVIYGEAGQYDKALGYFNKSIAIKPNYSAYGNRGLTFYFLSQYGSALEDFNRALQLNENFVEAYFNRGNVYLRTGNIELAIGDFKSGCNLGDKKSCSALQTYEGMTVRDHGKR